MSFHVQGQVVAAGERPRAEVALEGLGPGVLPVVPRQLVGPGKLPAASIPRALVRLLPHVGHHVPLQGRALREDLLADRTEMRLPNLQALREVCI